MIIKIFIALLVCTACNLINYFNDMKSNDACHVVCINCLSSYTVLFLSD